MTMKPIMSFIVCVVLLWACATSDYDSYQMSPREQAVNQLLGRTARALKQEHHMKPIGTVISMPGGVVLKLGLSFQLLGPLAETTLRPILVDSAQKLLAEINADLILKPSLKHYPFEISDVEIEIFLIDNNGRGLRNPYISIAEMRSGTLSYERLEGIEIPRSSSETKESYQDALDVLQGKKPDPFSNTRSNPPEGPKTVRVTDKDKSF